MLFRFVPEVEIEINVLRTTVFRENTNLRGVLAEADANMDVTVPELATIRIVLPRLGFLFCLLLRLGFLFFHFVQK